MFPHGDERLLEVQQPGFGLGEVPVVAAQLEHLQHQHQRTILTGNNSMCDRSGTVDIDIVLLFLSQFRKLFSTVLQNFNDLDSLDNW